ncbi:MAG: cation diffusion facilitator family transporter [Lachnospiraceae bacterium]|nr:cation diffusion facilitator family transporter [Lachnospiraceae bacterium]
MIHFLAKLFIKDPDNTKDPGVRQKYGVLSGAVGIFLNLCLFAGKLIAGILSGAISITADAFNNLSDAGSSIITLTGFRLAGAKPDPEHPFGHGRIEYLAGLIVSMLVILMGFELMRTSFGKILHPSQTTFSLTVVVILAVSILVKIYMYAYNSSLSRRLDSVAMKSTAADSLSDTVATSAVLASTVFTKCTGITIDGWVGLAVSLFIIYSGFTAAADTVSPLLGQAPSPEFIAEVKKVVMSYSGILGVHDLVVHDYGPGRRMMSLHAEVPANEDILKAHDTIDNIEMRLSREYGIETVIHMDPISVDDPETTELRRKVGALVEQLGKGYSFHDFRIVKGDSHTNVLFDVVMPYDAKLSADEVIEELREKVRGIDVHYRCIINIDRDYVR